VTASPVGPKTAYELFGRNRFFPRFMVFRRSVALAEARLAQLPWVILAPVVGAFVGTAWALSEPVQRVRNGYVVGLSFGEVLVPAALGGLGGVLGVWLLLFAYAWVRYRLFGDPDYTCRHIRLEGRDSVFLDSGLLSAEFPTGLSVLSCRRSGRDYIAPFSTTAGAQGWTFIGAPAEPGKYDCRWYCPMGRFEVELARGRFVIPNPIDERGFDDESFVKRALKLAELQARSRARSTKTGEDWPDYLH
jgi:hypothetical protein